MKTIGLLGGMSWESTVTYYQIINEAVKKKLGGLHSAKILLYSVDFAEIEECQARGEWEKSAEILGKAARGLQEAGADFLVICTNTMHKVAPQIQEKMTAQIARALEENLNPRGVIVMLEAEHTCMTMRGIKKPGSKTVTMTATGVFQDNYELQNRFLSMVKQG